MTARGVQPAAPAVCLLDLARYAPRLMLRRATALALASALFAAAGGVVHDAPRVPPAALAASAVRPFVLPGLWRRMREASLRAEPAEAVAAGRLIAELLPEWTDGRIHVAWIMALDLAREADGAAAAVDHLLRAVAWLTAAADERAARDPRAAAELLLGAATIVAARRIGDPALAAEFRQRTGHDLTEVAHRHRERALALAPDPAIEDAHAFGSIALAAGAVRMRDLPRAEAMLQAAARLLDERPGPQARAAARAIRELPPLEQLLTDRSALAAIATRPWLTELGEALRELRDG